MAILKGFPPSNIIGGGHPIPKIVEVKIKIKNLPYEEKFISYDKNEYYFKLHYYRNIRDQSNLLCRAICYKSKQTAYTNYTVGATPGEIRYFDNDAEVFWLKNVYNETNVVQGDCCQECGTKLVQDQFSSRFGDFCPNENCSWTNLVGE
jgi:hypothetical protein